MSVEWLYASVRSIASICMLISLVECAVDEAHGDGFRLICGAVVSLSVVRMLSAALGLSG